MDGDGFIVELDDLYSNFLSSHTKLMEVFTFNDNVKELIGNLFKGLKKEALVNNGHYMAGKIDHNIRVVENLYKHSPLKVSFTVIFQQVIISTVSLEEAFLKELISLAIRFDPTEIYNLDKITIKGEQLREKGFDISSYLFEVIKTSDMNFQDVKSTKRTFKKYTAINMDNEVDISVPIVEKAILLNELRHNIIHNNGCVDNRLLSGLEKTTYKKRFVIGEEIDVLALSPNAKELCENMREYCTIYHRKVKEALC